MCADGVKSPAEKYLYPNAISGMIRIAKEEGLATFYKGLWPNVVRSVLMSKLKLKRRVEISKLTLSR
jgi:dicarboxylate transporter 10